MVRWDVEGGIKEKKGGRWCGIQGKGKGERGKGGRKRGGGKGISKRQEILGQEESVVGGSSYLIQRGGENCWGRGGGGVRCFKLPTYPFRRRQKVLPIQLILLRERQIPGGVVGTGKRSDPRI